MSGFASRWVVAREIDIASADLDVDGQVLPSALDRWILGACEAYLDLCTGLRAVQDQAGLERKVSVGARPDRTVHDADAVLVSARATEFRPDSFTIAVRVRWADAVLDTMCAVQLEDASGRAVTLTDEIRDELIALEHAASHIN